MTVAALDIGTNSVRLLITDEAGTQLDRRMRITRLGQGVDATGALSAQAIGRTLAVLEEYAETVQRADVTGLRVTATSAARDASNREEFFAPARRLLRAEPELLSGDEEAALSFAGATADVDPALGPFLVVDIGGGSTEFVLGSSAPETLLSVDMGCVRMTERHLTSDPPTSEEIRAVTGDVDRALDAVMETVPVADARTMVGLAGTVTSLAASALGLEHYDPSRTHGYVMGRAEVDELVDRLASVDVERRRSMLIEPQRADVIVGGGLVLGRILDRFGFPSVTVSEKDILDGLAASLLGDADPGPDGADL